MLGVFFYIWGMLRNLQYISGDLMAFLHYNRPGDRCNLRYLTETDLNLTKSREITFILFCNCSVVLAFCTEHDSYTAVLCAKFRNDRQLKWISWIYEIPRASRNIPYYHKPRSLRRSPLPAYWPRWKAYKFPAMHQLASFPNKTKNS